MPPRPRRQRTARPSMVWPARSGAGAAALMVGIRGGKSTPLSSRHTSMTPGTEIAVPLWLLALLVCLAAWALASRVVLPLWRGYVRRQDERVLEELGGTQKLRIEPFRLTRRDLLVDRLVNDPEVQDAIDAAAAAGQGGA